MSQSIDFVLPWVDGSDPAWLKQKAQYSGENEDGFVDASIARYRDWDNLQYWFRGVEKYTPWVNRIHFVTWGHLPCWLNTENPKLHIVRHEDYIPSDYLPVFSSRPIELNIHRISGLSNNFVFFNDDCFIIDNMKPSDFFREGVPCDTAALSVLNSDNLVAASSKLLAMHVINRHFNKKKMMKKDFWKWINPHNGVEVFRTLLLMPWKFIPDIYTAHGPNAYTKSLFEEIWREEPELLHQTCTHRFRSSTDVVQHIVLMFPLLWKKKGIVVLSAATLVFGGIVLHCILGFGENVGFIYSPLYLPAIIILMGCGAASYNRPKCVAHIFPFMVLFVAICSWTWLFRMGSYIGQTSFPIQDWHHPAESFTLNTVDICYENNTLFVNGEILIDDVDSIQVSDEEGVIVGTTRKGKIYSLRVSDGQCEVEYLQ